MRAGVRELVDLDDDEPGHEGIEGEVREGEVRERALAFLGRGMGGLQQEDGLREDEQAAGVEEGVSGEEDERLEEDAGPNVRREEDYASLGDDSSADDEVIV